MTDRELLELAAWMHKDGGVCSAYDKENMFGHEYFNIPLYAAPVRTKDPCNPLQDLTDDEILPDGYGVVTTYDGLLEFARAVIAADREKNK